jgi:hypothetical protein
MTIAAFVEIIELCDRDKSRLELRNFERLIRGICEAVTLRYCQVCKAYETRKGMIKTAREALMAEGYHGRYKLLR